MTVDDFIAMQQQVIGKNGIANYLPALMVETQEETIVNVLEDMPEGPDIELLARDWALQVAKSHDYFLAFKLDSSHFRVIARVGGVTSQHDISVGAGL